MPNNLLVFYTDQQRKDSLGCYGNPVAQTPHLDALARRGTLFHNHYAANPVCSPSRASFMTGRNLQAHRLIDNGIALPRTEITLADALAARNYRTCAVGKLHLTPYNAPLDCGYEESYACWQSGRLDDWTGPYYGFDEVRLTLGHGDLACTLGGHYGRWVEEHFGDLTELARQARAGLEDTPYRSNLPQEAYSSTWVADQAISYLHDRADEEQPFFLFASFPDPHHPFTPPGEYADRFADCAFPAPHRAEGENDRKPLHWRRAMTEKQHPFDGGAHRPLDMTEDDWHGVYAATYGMVSLIDDSMGRVLDALDALGLAETTTIAFTTDHGDLMGDHHFLYKGPYPCRSLLNIPFIVAHPGTPPGECNAMMSNVDALPTLLDLLDVPIPDVAQGRSFKSAVTGEAPVTDTSALCCGWSKDSPLYYHQSLYEDRYRISYYPNQDDGELYDLEGDPFEMNNIYHQPEYRTLRNELLLRLYREVARAEPSYPPVVAQW
ncbi:MAG: sulfatase family protein [Armatimonadota bacterium]